MNLRRLLKILFGSFLGQGVTVVTQLLIPPFFLRYYGAGVAAYGEWLALSASISYLGMFNYGLQSYANNEMTILYSAGDTAGAKRVQAGALRLLLALVGAFIVIGLAVFLMPIAGWLRLHQVSPFGAQLTLYLLVLQFAVNMLFGLLINGFMMVGIPHRGNYWQCGQRLCSAFAMATAIFLHAPFSVLAGVQLGSLFLFSILVVIDVKLNAPVLTPSLRYGNWSDTVKIIGPSAHFGLISVGGFLTWQMPILIIQRVLGAEVTGIFGLVRTVFQMTRQILSIPSATISQDITEMWGRKDWPKLRKLYDMSERVVLFLIPLVTIGTLLLCPFLFTVWLHKRSLYDPAFCFMMAVISGVLGIKEHKTQFQGSSNNHTRLSWIIVTGYSGMLLVALPVMKFFGLMGFLSTWLAWEIIQTAIVLRLNDQLFPSEFRVAAKPLIKLAVFTTLAFAAAAYPAFLEQRLTLFSGVALAIGVSLLLAIAAFQVFGMRDVAQLLQARIRNRRALVN